MKDEVLEYTGTLEPVIDFDALQKGDKVLNIEAAKVELSKPNSMDNIIYLIEKSDAAIKEANKIIDRYRKLI